MDTLQRLKWVVSSHKEEEEEEEIVPEDMIESELAAETAFKRKLGNFPFKYLPLDPPLHVRGETYKLDHVKIDSGDHKFDCVGLEVYAHDKAVGGITRNWRDSNFTALQTLMESDRFKLIVHYLVPGTPQLTATFYFLAREGVLEDGSKFATLFKKFASKTLPDQNGVETEKAADEFRTKTFKFIPRFVKGASMAKRLAGEKPAIICRKIPSKFYVDDGVVEINLDISGSRIAAGVLSLVKKQLKGMVLDMVFLLEGKDENELPEEIISGLRFFNPRLDEVESYEK